MDNPNISRQTRADSRRNRQELLRVGAQTLAELGVYAPTREIARRAGVSVGTFFRHFPSKDDLISEIIVDHFTRLRAIAEEIEATDGLAPREAFEAYMERAGAQIAPDRSFFQAMHIAGTHSDAIRSAAFDLDNAVGRLLARAQADGSIRSDLVANDIHTIISIVTATTSPDVEFFPDRWRRYLTLTLDGMGGTPPRELPVPPMTFEDYPAMNEERQRRREESA
ncbi:MAG TPA: TetR/AcrR family transcriptional regulator [Solirubrobacter sp.]